MASRGTKRKADEALVVSVVDSADGSAMRSVRWRGMPGSAPSVTNAAAAAAAAGQPAAAASPVISAVVQMNQARQRVRVAQLRRLVLKRKATAAVRQRIRVKRQKNMAARQSAAHWEPVDSAHGNKHLLLLTKAKHKAELAKIAQHWHQTDGVGKVESVHRIQNPALLRRFEHAKHVGLTEVIAYHGTKLNVPAGIYDSPTGFDMSRGEAVTNILWFARDASYSSTGFWHPVDQTALPFGNPGYGVDLFSGVYSPPKFKQILRVRLLLDSAQLAAGWATGLMKLSHSARCLPEYLITFR